MYKKKRIKPGERDNRQKGKSPRAQIYSSSLSRAHGGLVGLEGYLRIG